MKIFLLISMILLGLVSYAGDIYWDFNGQTDALGERTGSTYINGQKYTVKERVEPWGSSTMQIKNTNDGNTYRGNVDNYMGGTLRDNWGNTVKVNSYGY